MPSSDPGLPGLLDATSSIGRYFSLVGAMTTLIATAISISLLASGAPGNRPSFEYAARNLGAFGLKEFAGLGIAIVAVGLVLHPLQFPFTQLLEGYWGTTSAARRAMARSTSAHLMRWRSLEDGYRTADNDAAPLERRLSAIRKRQSVVMYEPVQKRLRSLERELVDDCLPFIIARQEAAAALSKYPNHVDEIMPTRLGNALRRYETLAGSAFGLNAVAAAPYLMQVADSGLREYVNDSRSDMDLAVRMALVWTFSTVVSVAFLWQYDLWMVVPVITSIVTYLSYRGAVSAAVEYGTALQVLVTLGRWDLYDALRLRRPADSELEHQQNQAISAVLQGTYRKVEYDFDRFK